jgi:hypothetical protein
LRRGFQTHTDGVEAEENFGGRRHAGIIDWREYRQLLSAALRNQASAIGARCY